MDHYLLFVSKAYSFAILRPLQAAIAKRGGRAAWFVHGPFDALLKNDERRLTTVKAVKDFNPKAVFVPGNWVPDFFPGVKVEIFHGFGIEKKGHFDIRGLFDLYCTHGPLTTRRFQALARKHRFFHVAETGWPKMDVLFQYPVAAPNSEFAREGKDGVKKPVVLYAPTFSPALCSAGKLIKVIDRLAHEGRYAWVIKFHPLMDKKIMSAYRRLEGEHLHVAKRPDIIPYMQSADLMLTDTSSVIMEFTLLNKPVVTFRTRKPQAHMLDVRKPHDLPRALDRALERPPDLLRAMRQFADQMHPYTDGKSSERVLAATDDFIANQIGKLKPKPLNLWRKYQVRRRLRYPHMR